MTARNLDKRVLSNPWSNKASCLVTEDLQRPSTDNGGPRTSAPTMSLTADCHHPISQRRKLIPYLLSTAQDPQGAELQNIELSSSHAPIHRIALLLLFTQRLCTFQCLPAKPAQHEILQGNNRSLPTEEPEHWSIEKCSNVPRTSRMFLRAAPMHSVLS